MEVTSARETLLETLDESRSFKRNKINWSIFYGTACATTVMFLILVSLSGWSISIGGEINNLVAQGQETLTDVQRMLPDAVQALDILKFMCKHENFTRTYGHDACPSW